MILKTSRFVRITVPFLLALFFGTSDLYAQMGHVMSGVGPVDQAWSGAGTANPQDALGALYWNPASITGFESSSLSFSVQLLFPTGSLGSTINQGAFQNFGPPVTLSGTTSSTAGPFPIPSIGFIFRKPDSRLAFGVSAFGVGGFGVDYEGSNPPFDQSGNLVTPDANPILTPQFPRGGYGFGAMASKFFLFQISPTVAYQINDQISIGIAPTLNYALLEVNPFPASAPQMVPTMTPMGEIPLPLYPDAPSAGALGVGLQAGFQMSGESGFKLGASLKTPQWFQEFEFESEEVASAPPFAFRMDYPMIASLGIGYSGLEGWEFAADVRYIDFANTEGFSDSGFDASGAVKGFGWESIASFAAGIQYNITDKLPLRVGYSFNESPITSEVAFYNAPANALIQHRLSGGFSYVASEKFTASFAVQHGFKNEVAGEWNVPMMGGAVPGTEVTTDLSTLFFIFGASLGI